MDTETDGVTLSEPLECCGGERIGWTPLGALNGKRVCVIIIQHELWCCKAEVEL